ncbi:MAG: hypothetical protein WA678_09310, partial [Rhabdochlamydiaceae bacterium]
VLGQFVGVATRPEPRRQGHTRESRTWRRGDKMAQKGDFAGAGILQLPLYPTEFSSFSVKSF